MPGCFVQSDIQPSNRNAWRSWEGALRSAMLATEGFHEYRLYRFLGNENRFMRAELWSDLADARRFWHEASMRSLLGELGTRPFRQAPRVMYFEVLHQIAGPGTGNQEPGTRPGV
jgi:quinol monooxygenase YgiN